MNGCLEELKLNRKLGQWKSTLIKGQYLPKFRKGIRTETLRLYIPINLSSLIMAINIKHIWKQLKRYLGMLYQRVSCLFCFANRVNMYQKGQN